ncbi:unnamed protein product [Hydatigera taeniaeformis]|uniref:Uncharacterized protein n=1 Tax=Hydatigena taeniaeformis TaxID=6205 RepID=A0A0R3WLX2_HYDTA|nr:unnamed protein product [Hydatigera taeniaeformis]
MVVGAAVGAAAAADDDDDAKIEGEILKASQYTFMLGLAAPRGYRFLAVRSVVLDRQVTIIDRQNVSMDDPSALLLGSSACKTLLNRLQQWLEEEEEQQQQQQKQE